MDSSLNILFDLESSQEEQPKPSKKSREVQKENTRREKKIKLKMIEKDEPKLDERLVEPLETRKLNKLQIMRQTQEEIIEEAKKNLAETNLRNYLKVDENSKEIRVGTSYQAVIPPLGEKRAINREVKRTWDPEVKCDMEKYFKELDAMLGEGVVEAKALKLLTRKEYNVEESLRMVKKKRNYYKEFFKADKSVQPSEI